MPSNRKQVFDRFVSTPALIGKTTKDESRFPRVYGEDVREGTRRSRPAGTAWTRVLVPYRCLVCIIQGNQIEFVWSSTAVHHMKECRSTISCSLVPTSIIAC